MSNSERPVINAFEIWYSGAENGKLIYPELPHGGNNKVMNEADATQPDRVWKYSPFIQIYDPENQDSYGTGIPPKVRKFDTGATRDTAEGKYDFEGFLSPLVLCRYAEYMHKHRKMADGSMRDSDNWQKGIPFFVYMKSATRHFMDWWYVHRGLCNKDLLEDALCALLFNVMGYLHEVLKGRKYYPKTGE